MPGTGTRNKITRITITCMAIMRTHTIIPTTMIPILSTHILNTHITIMAAILRRHIRTCIRTAGGRTRICRRGPMALR